MGSIGVDPRPDNKAEAGPAPSSSSAPVSSNRQPAAASEDRAPTAAERKIAVLGPTLRFKGDLSAEEDFILQGRIQGSIYHTQSLIVGTGGSVVGTIRARMVVIDGNVEGDLYGTEAVVVHETGRVMGNIFAPRVGLAEGAVFNGRIDMTGTSSASHGNHPVAAHPAGQPSGHPAPHPAAANSGTQASTSQSGIHRRIDSATMSPGRPLSAEETERVLAAKAAPKSGPKIVTVLPPPPRREQAG